MNIDTTFLNFRFSNLFIAGKTCKGILKAKPNSPSGTYKVTTDSGDWISVDRKLILTRLTLF